MSQYDYKPEYKRNLPHFQPPGATLFVTFRLADSLPLTVLKQLKKQAAEREKQINLISDGVEQASFGVEQASLIYQERKKQFGRWDEVLDRAATGPHWLQQPEIAAIIVESLHYRDGKVYDLDTFCIMSNHAHVVFTPLEKEEGIYHPLQMIMHSLKRHTARQGNKILEREGNFWHHESYDHVIRDRLEWERIVRYVLNNPVKVGLVASWQDWLWSYLKP